MRRFLLFALLVSSCVAEQRPNILLIVADDLGYGDVSAYGCKEFRTPHLDSIAKSGMRFTSGYVAAPVCGPSRAGLMTGRHPCRVLPYDGNPPPGSEAGLPLTHKTLADHLKAAGYRTAAMGKWHLGETPQHHPMSRGFDEFFGFLSGMHNYFKAEDEKWGPLLRGREKTELKEYLTFALADEACAFIRRPAPEPYFLYLAFNAPHVPLEAPENYLAKTAHITDARRRVCAAMILALDDAIGRVMAAVDQKNTLVVFLSDNGAALIKGSAENGGSNVPLRGSKAQLWEGGIRVPFFMQWPGRIAAGGVSDTPVSSLDLLPTLLAAGKSSHHAPRDEPRAGDLSRSERSTLDGVNLLPWLEGKAESPKREPFFWKFGVGQFAIRSGDLKLVRVNADKGLFNVREDISETTDHSKARPILARQLEAAWKKWDAGNLPAVRIPRAKQGKQPAVTVPSGKRPNIVLVLADDFGYECVGANGCTSYKTPALDKLAATGVRFEHCYAQPVCTPTRVQIMTGSYNVRNYTDFAEMDPKCVTFANILKQAGYATCIAGKWQLGADVNLPRKFGFDENCLWNHTRSSGRYMNPGLDINGVAKDFTNKEYGPDIVSDYALDFIQRKRSEPFFLYYTMMLTHAPFQPTPDSPGYGKRGGGKAPARPDGINQEFADMVAYADKLIGKLIAKLDELHIRDNTLIIILGDNGTQRGTITMMGERKVIGGKGQVTNTGMKVPLIVSWPAKAAPGKVSCDLVDTTDILPSICEAAGATVPAELKIDGHSFLPQVRGEKGQPRDWFYSWIGPQKDKGIIAEFASTHDFKLSRTGDFYDLRTDIEEKHPLKVADLKDEAAIAAAKLLQGTLDLYRDARPAGIAMPFTGPRVRGKKKLDSTNKKAEDR